MAGGTVASAIEILADGCRAFNAVEGERLGSCSVPAAAEPRAWTELTCELAPLAGVHDMCLRFVSEETGPLLELDYFWFE